MSLRAMSILNVILVLALIAISVGWWLDHHRLAQQSREFWDFAQRLLNERTGKLPDDPDARIKFLEKSRERVGRELRPIDSYQIVRPTAGGAEGEEVRESVSFEDLPAEVQAELRKHKLVDEDNP